MILPRGITGFDIPKGHAEVNLRAFRADCWQVVIPLKGRAQEQQQVSEGGLASFVTRVLTLPGGEVTVLLNKVHPWLGFCRPPDPGSILLEFVDGIHVAAKFASLGRYQVLSRAELDQPASEEICVELGEGEVQQLRYWSKLSGRGNLRLGDVVFNFWD